MRRRALSAALLALMTAPVDGASRPSTAPDDDGHLAWAGEPQDQPPAEVAGKLAPYRRLSGSRPPTSDLEEDEPASPLLRDEPLLDRGDGPLELGAASASVAWASRPSTTSDAQGGAAGTVEGQGLLGRDAQATGEQATGSAQATTFAPESLRFPALGEAFRAYLAGRRAPGASAALADPLMNDAVAALLAGEHGAPPALPPERLEALREAVNAALLDRSRPWGAEPFLLAAAHEGQLRGDAALPRFLVDQLQDDAVRGNAFMAAEYLILGLQQEPARFARPLLEEARGLPAKPGEKVPQGPLMAAHLALLWAADEQAAFARRAPSWWDLARADHRPESCANLATLSPADQRVLFDAAERLVWRDIQWQAPSELDACAFGARRLAWALLENGPMQHDRLARLATEGDRWESFVPRRAISTWLLREPESLAHPNRAGIVVAAVREHPWASWSELRVLLQHQIDCAPTTGLLADQWEWLHGPALRVPSAERVARAMAHREAFIAAFREALRAEAEPYAQLAFCRLLTAWNDEASRDLVAQVLVTHFGDDDVMNNAKEAGQMLREIESGEAVGAARAALAVGTETGDWQMIERSAQFLLAVDPEFDPAAHPEAIIAMTAHLGDDAIEGNAAAARRFLSLCGEAARPALEATLAEGDEQARRKAKALLQNLE